MNCFLMPNEFDGKSESEQVTESVVHEIADDTKLLVSSLGGPRGMLESGAPAILFVLVYAISKGDLKNSVYAAASIGIVFAILRIVKREPITQVVAGLFGLAFSAWLATKSGKAENFFLPGILTNVAYAAACLVSLAINKPLLGYVIESLKGTNSAWLTKPLLVKRYRAITFLWAAVFLVRVGVMAPLYFANQTVALGFFKLALGWPLFALAAYATYAMSSRKLNL